MAEEAIHIHILLAGSGSGHEEPGMIYASVISDRKWPLKKRLVIADIKATSKHSFKTETTWYKKKNQLNRWACPKCCVQCVCVCINAGFTASNWVWHCMATVYDHCRGPCSKSLSTRLGPTAHNWDVVIGGRVSCPM